MRKIFGIFSVKREERWLALTVLVMAVCFNALVINKYWDRFSELSDHYHKLFVNYFHISGFDPLTYVVVSSWETAYNIYRHPLLAFFMYLPNQVNQGLMMLTGMNWAQVVVAAILVFCTFYALLLLGRICREIVGLGACESAVLTLMTYSFAYVTVSSCVPDHFIMSMFLLMLTLYVSGKKMQKGKPMTVWQTILFFILTAGTSLNNGLKVFMANLFVNGWRRFLRPANLIVAILLPSVLIWVGARMEWKYFERPKYVARQAAKAKKDKALRTKIMEQYRDTAQVKDSAAVAQGVKKIIKQKALAKYRRDHKQPWNKHAGKPIGNGEFEKWTDISTNRWSSIVENLFGESIQLHPDYLLGDTLTKRPVIVTYRYWWNYAVEAFIVLLFVLGILCGWRQKYLWLVMSFFGFDMLLHIGLGFGINEVYIMTAHWIYVIPIAMAYLLRVLHPSCRRILTAILVVLTLYLYVYNGYYLASYLL